MPHQDFSIVAQMLIRTCTDIDSQDIVPRYLFRAYGTHSGGGIAGLNTPQGIIPHGFLDGANPHQTIHDMDEATLRAQANGHLTGQRPARTDPAYSEFSSWAGSLALVLEYSSTMAQSGVHICVLDRFRLPENTKAYHAKALMEAGACNSPYPHEYLVHGRVEGPGFKAIPVEKLKDIGLFNEVKSVHAANRKWWYPISDVNWQKEAMNYMNETSVRKMRAAAEEFGPYFTFVMTVAFATVDRRHTTGSGDLTARDIKVLADVLADLDIPDEYSVESIYRNKVYSEGFPMVSQLNNALKGILEYRHGKGARRRPEILMEVTAPETVSEAVSKADPEVVPEVVPDSSALSVSVELPTPVKELASKLGEIVVPDFFEVRELPLIAGSSKSTGTTVVITGIHTEFYPITSPQPVLA